MHIIWPAFIPDSRGNKLKEYEVMERTNRETPEKWLYLCGPQEAANQFLMLNEGKCEGIDVPQDRAAAWTHALHFPSHFHAENWELANLLKEILSLTAKYSLDCAVAVDWYKVPPTRESPEWSNTEIGDLVYRGKYYHSGADRETARRALVSAYVQLLDRHPLYRRCTQIVTVPGHEATGNSFGEQLAATVAERGRKRLVATQSPGGPRPQAKAVSTEIAEDHFAMPHQLEGDVIILDDVYRSGTTMNAVAAAAKRAGARRVFGLVAVRTMRN